MHGVNPHYACFHHAPCAMQLGIMPTVMLTCAVFIHLIFYTSQQKPAVLVRPPSVDVGLGGDLSPEISLGGDLSPEISSITKATGALALDADETAKATVGTSKGAFLPQVFALTNDTTCRQPGRSIRSNV